MGLRQSREVKKALSEVEKESPAANGSPKAAALNGKTPSTPTATDDKEHASGCTCSPCTCDQKCKCGTTSNVDEAKDKKEKAPEGCSCDPCKCNPCDCEKKKGQEEATTPVETNLDEVPTPEKEKEDATCTSCSTCSCNPCKCSTDQENKRQEDDKKEETISPTELPVVSSIVEADEKKEDDVPPSEQESTTMEVASQEA